MGTHLVGLDLNELRYFRKYSINYNIEEFVAENSMFNKSNFTKVSQTEVGVVEGNGTEQLVLSRIIIYKKSGVTCVPCLMIFR